ncbi:glycoside hydrolase family 3 C-terminal domain-containing protein [Nocardioides aurantiacus]|uniref:Exo-alpha-(1->6)-L-arabinopyranosidase n=1 Tax=Nocardioides aurantiacus TaxID=86796 RepID=A0A3N2CQE7_9ACTN|nr:glycoside hydrolase family 3 C-terminal domain-containing protein [Nocardioides aurantiacus]ROR89745.1 beta-glucosidase [Nocardioides aurantiacus]
MTQLDVDDVLPQLTLEEKVSLVMGGDFWHTAAVERLGVPRVMVADGPHGLRMQPDEGDHAGIGGSLPATCFPPAAGLASSWDRGLLAEVGAALAHEAREQGVSVVLGPGVNIKRSPLCGRNFEYLSEDPHLAGELALALVQELQAGGVGTSVKHFAANNQEDDRLRVSAEVDERTLREIYLPAFERVVTGAQPWTVMCAYNKVNGTYASEHHWLLTEVLRGEWGFEGVVVSDWGAVHDRVAALAAGLDLEMPPQVGVSDTALLDAARSHRLPPEVLDLGARRVLELVRRAQPTLDAAGDTPASATRTEEHHALARRAAAASAVLLRNEGGLLPLDPDARGVVAVLGAFATEPRYQGAGSSQVSPTRVDVPLEELRAALPGAQVEHAAGFALDGEPDEALLTEARDLAARADTVVLCLGLPAAAESEGFDRTHLELPADQLALLDAVARVHDRVVVVLANGSVVRVSDWEHRVGAVLECWLGGQAAGGGLADLLTGRVTPAGKLAETVPLRLQDTPSYLAFPGDSQVVRYGEGLFVGYRGFDAREQEVSHPFGFGLSYTTFALAEPRVEVTGSVAGGDLDVVVRVAVTNTGERAGAEVVQLYVAAPDATVTRPQRELKGFDRVALQPGETGEAVLHLDQRSFSHWSELHRRWAVEAGDFVLHVGTSSRDLPHATTLHLDAPSLAAPLGPGSTLHEWLADDRGRTLLAELFEQQGGGGILADEHMVSVIGTMPLTTLAGFGTAGLDHAGLRGLVERLDR